MAALKLTDRTVAAIKPDGDTPRELWDADVRGLFIRISPSSKIWGFRYRRPDGSQPRMRLGYYVSPDQADCDRTALTVAGARAKARKLRSEVDDGKDPATARHLARAEAKSQTIRSIDDLAEAYFAVCESGEYRPSRKRKRPKTIVAERYLYRKYLWSLGSLRVEALTRDAIKSLLRDLLNAGRGVTSNRVKGLLGQIYAWALKEGRVTYNPVADIQDMAEETPRERILTDAEMRALWKALNDPTGLRRPLPRGRDEPVMVSRPVRIAIQLAMLTLQRRAEIAMMRFDEIDFGAALWTIPAANTKAGRATAVPLCQTAIRLIREAISLQPDPGPDEAPSPYVFASRTEAVPHLSPAAISHAMRDIRAGINAPDITVHDLRRSGATLLAIAGVNPFILSKLLNHTGDLGGGSPITMAVYVRHDYIAEKRAAMLKLEEAILAIVSPGERPNPIAPPVVDHDLPELLVEQRSMSRFVARP